MKTYDQAREEIKKVRDELRDCSRKWGDDHVINTFACKEPVTVDELNAMSFSPNAYRTPTVAGFVLQYSTLDGTLMIVPVESVNFDCCVEPLDAQLEDNDRFNRSVHALFLALHDRFGA